MDVTAVGPVTILNTDFPHVELAEVDLAPVSKALGTAVDGVLGIDILQQVNFKLNYSQHTLLIGPLTKLGTLGAPVTLRRSKGQFPSVPICYRSQPGLCWILVRIRPTFRREPGIS